MELDMCQLEAIKRFVAYYCNIPSFEEEEAVEKNKVKTYKQYLLAVATQGIKVILENNLVPNLLFITKSILKTDSILISEYQLKKIVEVQNE